MAHSDRIQQLQQEIENIQEELLPLSRGAVFIKDPKKRRKCPLCQQNLFLYHINYEEMFLMCENSSCDFPFGYEAIQIVQKESQLRDYPVKASRDFFEYPTANVVEMPSTIDNILGAEIWSVSSMSFLSDCDRFSQHSDPEDLSLDKQEVMTSRLARLDTKNKQELLQNKEVQNSLDRIKELTEEMNQLIESKEKDSKVIKNKKWLQNLKFFEGSTGLKLLSDKENFGLSKPEPEVVKISLQPAINGSASAVNISIVMATSKGDVNITEQVCRNSDNEVDNNAEERTKQHQEADNNIQEVTSDSRKEIETNMVCTNGEKDMDTQISCINNSVEEEIHPNCAINSNTKEKCKIKIDCEGEKSNTTDNICREEDNNNIGSVEKNREMVKDS